MVEKDPANAEFAKLHADLKSAISLTQQMLDTGGAAASSGPAWTVGQRVEGRSAAAGGSVWYPAVVTAFLPSKNAVSVRYIGFGSDESLPAAAVRPLAPHPSGALAATDLKPGLKVSAKYAGDGQWYGAKIASLVEDDATLSIVEGAGAEGGATDWRVVKVTYTQYGNTETVPMEYL